MALKVFHEPLADDGSRGNFEREVAALRSLDDVDGVVALREAGVADGRGWVTTELFPTTLATRLRSLGRLQADEVRSVARTLTDGLQRVHDRGVVHRDLKPSNIYLDAQGAPVLGDFGIARGPGESTLTSGSALSLGWVAPETIEDGTTSRASDRYALGATMYALLAGHPPHSGPTGSEPAVGKLVRRIASGSPAPLPSSTPAWLSAVIFGLLAVDPAERPELDQVAAALKAGVAPAATSPRSRRPMIFAGLAAAVGVVAIALALRGSANPTADAAISNACGVDGPVVLCETFDDLAEWEWIDGEPLVAEVATADGIAVFTPLVGDDSGGAFLQRPLGATPSRSDLHARIILRVTGDGRADNGEWQAVFAMADESQHAWTIGVQRRNQGFALDLGFANPPDDFGGSLAEVDDSLDRWTCLQLALPRSTEGQPSLLLDGDHRVDLPDAPAAEYGEAMVLRVGAIWMDAPSSALALEVDQVAVATEPIMCDGG